MAAFVVGFLFTSLENLFRLEHFDYPMNLFILFNHVERIEIVYTLFNSLLIIIYVHYLYK